MVQLTQDDTLQPVYDTIIIGSGFGGSMVAHSLVHSGQRVLMLERGDWVRRGPHNWEPHSSACLIPSHTTETPYRVLAGGYGDVAGPITCVGGQSVFFGGVTIRFREADFEADPDIVGESGACWPHSYADIEPYYTRAEQLLNVAGETGYDPTEPFRSGHYPQKLNGLSHTSGIIEKAASSLSLTPFRLPLAINYSFDRDQMPCIACSTCDSFACAIQAKNDLSTCLLPDLIRKGLRLKANTVATRLITQGNRVVAVECYEQRTGQKRCYHAKRFILAAGALSSPHLLLASNLEDLNPCGHTIGHYLMRHSNAVVLGIFPSRPNNIEQFHKQVGINDFYFGHPTITHPSGKLGNIQQIQTPSTGLIQALLPKPFGQFASLGVKHIAGLLVIAEDQPQYNNSVTINRRKIDRFGLPQLMITHHYSERDEAATRALIGKARQILRKAGAWFSHVHRIKTFSHAVGTVRMGNDPRTSALNQYCRFRGVPNLYVVDGSFMPMSAGVNPSLTIAANALRVGEHIARISHYEETQRWTELQISR
jgi:choline dehydrogenase-like flavoprotein